MSPIETASRRARQLADDIADQGQSSPDVASDISNWSQNAASAVDYVLIHPLNDVVNAVGLLAGLVTFNTGAANRAFGRVFGQGLPEQTSAASTNLQRVVAKLARLLAWVLARLPGWLKTTLRAAERYAERLVARDRTEWLRAIRQADALTVRRIRGAMQAVQREAAQGYRKGNAGRASVVSGLLDLAVNRDPVLGELVSKSAGLILDAIEIDDPLARIAAGFIIRELTERLGIDAAIGDLLHALAGPLAGGAEPRTLTDVIADLAARVTSLEGQWGTFMADGGPQILQAGEEWASITSLIVDVGLLAFFAQLATFPAAWAAEVSDVAGPVVNDGIMAIADLIRAI